MPLIVVIDDDAGTRLLVSQVLKKEALQVMVAEDGVKSVALVSKHKPDWWSAMCRCRRWMVLKYLTKCEMTRRLRPPR